MLLHVAADGIGSFFLWLSIICMAESIVCMDHIFIHSSIDGYLGRFCVLAIVNSVGRAIGVHISF